ncbi:MAG: diaminohydroxyphosphoribosylaminopyrimidine deaminase [Actinomycetota bacterium]|jgi:diaminohydroxyphosphoribosylaminopyrimidine deaminase/5-amino-6-(5-phosphoribosylamino)uracil reductase
MTDHTMMQRALARAAKARTVASPNPWVGCVIVTTDGRVFDGATEEPGGRHAERVALDAARAAGADVRGSTVYTTLEPCSHHGRTPPCTDALIEAGVTRVVSALEDPDTKVGGRGFAALRAAGIGVDVGCGADEANDQLLPYLHHRRTGRPFVILKLATTVDGRTAAADGTSQWITGDEARRAAHRLRAESDAILVGAGTVRTDDPSLTTRLVPGRSPRRVVLGAAPTNARVHPCLEWSGELEPLLDQLGSEGVVQLLVEGGATVAGEFDRRGLVNRYVAYLAPAFMGGNDGTPLFTGAGAPSISNLRRGRFVRVTPVGDDLEIVVDPSIVRSGHD